MSGIFYMWNVQLKLLLPNACYKKFHSLYSLEQVNYYYYYYIILDVLTFSVAAATVAKNKTQKIIFIFRSLSVSNHTLHKVESHTLFADLMTLHLGKAIHDRLVQVNYLEEYFAIHSNKAKQSQPFYLYFRTLKPKFQKNQMKTEAALFWAFGFEVLKY